MTLALSLIYPYQIAGQFCFNSFLTLQIKKYFSINVSRNFVSSLHASGAIILAGLTMYNEYDETTLNAARIWSSGYFLYDTIFMLKYDKHSIVRSAYLYHHLVTTYWIQLNPEKYYGTHALFLGELSNLPTYVVYYYLKTNPQHPRLPMYKTIQKYMYSLIRFPISGYYLSQAYFNNHISERGPIKIFLPIYLMGVMWSWKLFSK